MPRFLPFIMVLAACDQGFSAKPPLGKLLEIKLANTSGYEFHGNERLVLASSPAELEQRVQAVLSNTDVGPLKASDDVHLYLLFGGSGNGLDDLRGTRVEVHFDEPSRTFRTLIRSRTTLDVSGFKGTTDMQYINYGAQAGKLAHGDYAVKVYEVRQVFKTPRDQSPTVEPEKLIRELTFTVR